VTAIPAAGPALRKHCLALWRWAANEPLPGAAPAPGRLQPLRMLPFLALHAGCLAVAVVGASAAAAGAALLAYCLRMFFVTAFYHRYFSHRTYSASRPMQLAMAALGCTAGQRGPLWWAAHHRAHHAHADTARDPHSPRHRGFLYSHMLWFFTAGAFHTEARRVRDWRRYRELVWLDHLWWLPFLAFGAAAWGAGALLAARAPALGTDGPQMFVWVFCVSTVALYHATYTVNSLAHRWGTQRFSTGDDSRNNAVLAALTLGEGWHNNHHRYPAAARQGFYPGELDPSYLGLRALAALGLVRDLRPVPARVLEEGRSAGGARA